MKQFRFKTKLIAQFFLVAVIGFSTLVGCKSYDQDIEDLNGKVTGLLTDVGALKTSVAALETSVGGMTYIQSITLGNDGKLTITPSVGNAITYDAKNYVTYDIKLEGNKLYVNGTEKGTVTLPALTFENGLLKSGGTTVADLTNWLKNGLTSVDGFLAINGQKTTFPADAPIVATQSAGGNLLINGVDTGVKVNNVYSVIDGYLAVNGVKTTVAIPAGNSTSVIFTKVDGKIVSATISDGTDSMSIVVNPSTEPLASILFVPTWIDGGIPAIEVGFINGITPPIGKVLFNEQNVVYRFNPTAADLSKITEWAIVNNSARVSAPGQGAPGDKNTLFATPAFTNNNDGSGTFTLKVGTWVEPATGQTHLIALQANGKDFYSGNATSVVSDYAKVAVAQYNAFISDSKKSNANTNVYVHYRAAVPAIGDANDFELVVNTPVDLDELVWATADKGGAAERKFETYGFKDYKYEFSLPTYLGGDNVTNQNSFVTLNAETNVLSVNSGSSVLDRNPLVLVKLLTNGGKLVAQSYIKFKIVATPTKPPVKPAPVKYTVTAASAYNYPQLFVDNVAGVSAGDFKEIILSWANINANVYNPLGLTHNQFVAKYGGLTPTITVKLNDVTVASPDLTVYDKLFTALNGPDVDTYAMKYQVTPKHKFGKTTVTYKFDTGAITDAAVEITFEFTINKPVLEKTILEGYRWNNSATDAMTQGVNDGTGYQMKSYIGSAFAYGSPAYRNVFGSATAGKIDDATHTFQFKVTTPVQTGAVLTPAVGGTIDATFGVNTTTWSGQVVSLTSKLKDVEKVYAMQLVTTYPNAETDVFDFNLHFVNPFSIELASPADFQLIDKVNGTADTQDVKANYIIKFKNSKNIITKGVAEVSDGANSVKASDYVDLSDASLGLFYELTPSGNYFTISKAGGNAFNKQSLLTWDGAAGVTLTSEQKVGTVKVKFVTNFAEVERTADDVTVKPE